MRQGVTALQAARTGASRGEEEEQRAERQLLADISVIVGITEQHCTFLKGLLQRRPPPLKSRSSSSIGASVSSVGGSEAGASSWSGGGDPASAGRLQRGRGGPPAPPPAPPGVRPQQIQTRSGAAGGKGSRTGPVERGARVDDSHEQDADGAPAAAAEWDPGPRADAGAEPVPLEEIEAAKGAETWSTMTHEGVQKRHRCVRHWSRISPPAWRARRHVGAHWHSLGRVGALRATR